VTHARDFIPFAPPDIGEEEIEAVIDTLRSGWITTGPRAAELEREFASYVGAPAALAMSSGTAALHSALLALGIGAGDAVALPTMTFASAAHVVEHVGARPVLIDSEPETLNIDPEAVERALQDRDVRCIAPVHLHGHPCDLTRIVELAAAHGVSVVEDAAHALPATINGITVGTPSDVVPSLAAFSFYATKNMTTAEGGMLTGPVNLVQEARSWSLHGMTRDAWNRNENATDSDRSWRYDVTRAGFKYNLPDIQAAIGLVQLKRLDKMYARRRSIAARYGSALADCGEISLPIQRDGYTHAWQIYAIRVQLDRLTIDRSAFVSELEAMGVGTSVHFIPIHQFTYYREHYRQSAAGAFPIADAAFEQLISLPIHSAMSDQDVDDVAEAVGAVAARHRR
jgi:dTDP-4-amino-4,6-dideoxygalactose transaminase